MKLADVEVRAGEIGVQLNRSFEILHRQELIGFASRAKDQARKWYDQAVASMEKCELQSEELRRLRAEAEEVLGLKRPRK